MHTVMKHGEQYRGYMQHDAQEFLLWMLDNVHEDLLRVPQRGKKVVVVVVVVVYEVSAICLHTRCLVLRIPAAVLYL